MIKTDKLTFDFVEINRNMRCIEIVFNPSLSELATVINRNMRCIEMIIKVP